VWIWVWEALLLSRALRRGRCQGTFWPSTAYPRPLLASLQKFIIFYWPSGLVRLESMQGLRRYCNSCVGTHIRSWQGHSRNTPSNSSPRPNFAAANLHARATWVLGSSRIGASWGKCYFPAKKV